MSVFNKIKTGLVEAISYEQGRTEVRTTKLSVASVNRYDAVKFRTSDKVRNLRR